MFVDEQDNQIDLIDFGECSYEGNGVTRQRNIYLKRIAASPNTSLNADPLRLSFNRSLLRHQKSVIGR
jgi:hypothetical protein